MFVRPHVFGLFARRPHNAAAAAAAAWRVLKLGAGGFITGIDIAPNGTKVIRTDTYGAYVWTGSAWSQLVNQTSMPAADFGFDANGDSRSVEGCYEIVIAPSNTARFYMLLAGRVFRSDNSGATWTRTAFTLVSGCDANENGAKVNSKKIAVDPNNADIVYVGTALNGLFVSLDAGASWASVATVLTSTTSDAVIIAFDPSSSVVGGKTQIIYASSYGRGVYRSTNGGTTWALTSGTPTTHKHLFCASDGILYLSVSVASDGIYKYTASTWTHLTGPGSRTWETIAVDPANPARIIIADDGGLLNQSLDHGANWTGDYFYHFPDTSGLIDSTDVPWIEDFTGASTPYAGYLSNGNMQFDPSQSNRLYVSHGVGVYYGAVPSTYNAYGWTDQSAGIEQLVANMVLAPPGGKPIACCWDRALWYVSDPDTYRTGYKPSYSASNQIDMGWHADYSPADPTRLVALVNYFGAEESCYSSDGGQTWTAFAAYPPLASNSQIAGSIAAGSNSNFVWVPSQDGVPYYTTNTGASWTAVSIAGVPTTGETGWGSNFTYNRHILCADRVNANTFYMYNNGAAADATYAGVYKSTNSGATWSRVKTTRFTSYNLDFFNAILRAVPLNAGHLFYTAGNVGGSITGSFFRSTDGGATFTALPNVAEVWAFGFGKAQSGGYPAVFIAGWVSGTWGIWRSDDGSAGTPTWTQIGDYPLGSMDLITWIEGDMDTFGRCYVGFRGSGCAYYG